MNKLRTAFLFTIMLTLAVIFVSYLTPAPITWKDTEQVYHFKLALALVIPALHVLAALYFFQGLTGFKEEFRASYRLVAVGVIVIGATLLASPMVTFFDLWDQWPMELGIINLPFVVAVAVIFAGIRTFYKKFEVKSVWRSLWFNVAFVASGVLLAVIMPHAPSSIPEARFDFGNAMFALSVFSLLATAFNIFAIRKHIVPSYSRVLTWLGGGLVFEALLVATSLVLKALGIDVRSAAGGLQDGLVLAAVPYLVSGYLFYQLTADTRKVATQTGAGIVDIIMFVSTLASSRQAVDGILDELRLVTARLRPGQELLDADREQLADVYLKLEQYLAKEEKLRSFTPTQVRQQVYARFNNEVSSTVDGAFWRKLPLAR